MTQLQIALNTLAKQKNLSVEIMSSAMEKLCQVKPKMNLLKNFL